MVAGRPTRKKQRGSAGYPLHHMGFEDIMDRAGGGITSIQLLVALPDV